MCYRWKYEDFDDEPLPGDGTLSHAVERIIEYVVLEAGYDVGWVMSEKYAYEAIKYRSRVIEKAFSLMHQTLGIDSIPEIDMYYDHLRELAQFTSRMNNLYIYGAGKYGKKCMRYLQRCNITSAAFLVTKKENEKTILNIPLCIIDDLVADDKSGIIVAIGQEHRQEVLDNLNGKVPNANIYCFMPYGY